MVELPGRAWRDRLAWFIGSGLGCGLSPLAPGSVGSLAAVALLYVLSYVVAPGWPASAAVGLLSIAGLAVGIWATGRMSTAENPDPGSATWDEFVGMWLTCLLVPLHSILWLGAAFLAFRATDVLKPWPCRRLERLPGGWGIMLDDVGAGIWSALAVQLLAAAAQWAGGWAGPGFPLH